MITEEEKKQNKELLERFPFLNPFPFIDDEGEVDNSKFSKEDYDYSFTMLDEMPDGWRKAFGEQMCQDIKDELIEFDYVNKYSIAQIKEKYGCYDDNSEVLTKDGWKYFRDVSYKDEFATLEDEKLIYQKPSDIISYEYSGDMYKLKMRGLDILVTPNHNLYVAKGSYTHHKTNEKRTYPFELCDTSKYFQKDKRFKKGCKWEGVAPQNDKIIVPGYTRVSFMKINNCFCSYHYDDISFDAIPFLRFLGFYVAEGYTYHHNGCQISIAYNPYDEENLVCKIILDTGMTFRNGKKNSGLKYIYNHILGHFLLQECGHKAWNKKVPSFVKNLPPKYIEEFLTYLYIGDGHKTKTSNILYTTSKKLADDVCELLLKAGYAFKLSSRDPKKTNNHIKSKHKIYEVNWLKKTDVEMQNSVAKRSSYFIEEYTPYSGKVYCVTIPNHILYIRRNGTGYWCGNSLRWYDNGYPIGELAEPDEVKTINNGDFIPKCDYETDVWLLVKSDENTRTYEHRKILDKCRLSNIISKYEDLSEKTCIVCGEPAKWTSTGWISPFCEKHAAEINPEYKEMFIPIYKENVEEKY